MSNDDFPYGQSKLEVDAWVLAKIVQAERYLQSLPWWKRVWLEFKWNRLDPIICRIDCWSKGKVCPWE